MYGLFAELGFFLQKSLDPHPLPAVPLVPRRDLVAVFLQHLGDGSWRNSAHRRDGELGFPGGGPLLRLPLRGACPAFPAPRLVDFRPPSVPALPERSEEHTSELQSLMRISYAVFCL